MDKFVHSFGSCLVLFSGESADSQEHGIVNGTCVEQKGAEDLLNAEAVFGGEERGSVFWRGELDGLSVGGGSPGMG